MSKASILKMALEEIARGVKKVDLGDLTRKPNVAARVQAVTRMAGDASKKVASKVDDWGWKGGKPGEVTGKTWDADVTKRWNDLAISTNARARKQLEKHAAKNPSSNIANNWKTLNQMLPESTYIDEPTANILGDFDLLESADIPREWTGKVLNSLYEYGKQRIDSAAFNLRIIGDTNIPDTLALFGPSGKSGIVSVAEKVSNAMRPMTNDQRETFLALLPEWTESLEDLAKAARTI